MKDSSQPLGSDDNHSSLLYESTSNEQSDYSFKMRASLWVKEKSGNFLQLIYSWINFKILIKEQKIHT